MHKVYSKTDVGIKRKKNEDTIFIGKNKFGHEIFIIADGMGGHNAGEEASKMACTIIGEKFINLEKKVDYKKFIEEIILESNSEIYKKALLDSKFNKMGTTVSLLIKNKNEIALGHIGDSRIYFTNEEKILQLTKDDTLIQVMLDNGTITQEEADNSQYKNVLVQALGTTKKISLQVKKLKLPKSYKLFLCSDGVTGEINDDMLHQLLNEDQPIDYIGDNIIDQANHLDGSDNSSVIIIESENYGKRSNNSK